MTDRAMETRRADGGPALDSLATGGSQAEPKKVFVKTFGCQMNVYDSERMTEALASSGYEATAAIDDADLIVLNTCHIREKAAEKVYSDLGRIRTTSSRASPQVRKPWLQ